MAPEWNSRARGVFYGLTLAHTRAHMLRAIMEGSACALRSVIDSMRRTGRTVNQIRAVAGGAQSQLLRQMRADVTNTPVAALSTVETTVLGAALLAAVGSGLCSDLQAAANMTTHVVGINEPNPSHRDAYEQAYGKFRQVYASLTPCFRQEAQV